MGTVKYSDSNNKWAVTISWSCAWDATSAKVTYKVTQNDYGRTFALVKKGDSATKYPSGTYFDIGQQLYFQVFRNGKHSQDAGPFTVTAPDPPTYTISYDANGGTGAPGSQNKQHGSNIRLSYATPTRDRYTFLGWSTNRYATSADYSAGSIYTSNASATLYAVWERIIYRYTLTISSDSHCSISVRDSNGTVYTNGSNVVENTILTVTVTPSSGYEIKSVRLGNSNKAATFSFTITANSTITATSSPLGLVHIFNGSGWDSYQVYIFNGSGWDMYCPYIFDGSQWKMCA